VVVLRFPSGTIVHIDNHRRAVYGYDQRLEVHTARGIFAVENVPKTTVVQASVDGYASDTPTSNGMERYMEGGLASFFLLQLKSHSVRR
jgi:myo-inositol 2-dehydrogenase/D-chiro-inositol 1-dehydrogenase